MMANDKSRLCYHNIDILSKMLLNKQSRQFIKLSRFMEVHILNLRTFLYLVLF